MCPKCGTPLIYGKAEVIKILDILHFLLFLLISKLKGFYFDFAQIASKKTTLAIQK
jgi:hypothetical protein